jgi:ATP-dependent DNA helicase RecQ
VKARLRKLEEDGLASYFPSSDKPTVRLNTERLEESNLRIPPEVYSERRDELLHKARAMQKFINAKQCRTKVLLEYFGEQELKPCGQCDICLGNKKRKPDLQSILAALDERSLHLTELSEILQAKEDFILNLLRQLEDEAIIECDENGVWSLLH